jgi:hypothetical protein
LNGEEGQEMNFIKFLKAAGSIGGGSVGLAIVLFGISIEEHFRDKNVNAYWLVLVAAIAIAFGAYRAWAGEFEKNTKPSLKIELTGALFEVSHMPHTQDTLIRIYAYLRVMNLSTQETIIKDGTLEMTVGGIPYKGVGDDISAKGNFIEHHSTLQIGGEKPKTNIFDNTISPFPRLLSQVNAEKPLRRGIPQEGFFAFTFGNAAMDWNKENPYVMPVTDVLLTLKDSFDGTHSIEGKSLDIPSGFLLASKAKVAIL